MGGMSIGASGVLFMMVILASMANIRGGEIPLTFIAVAVVYLGGEIVSELKNNDNVSHFGHLIGGSVGSIFGFLSARAKSGGSTPSSRTDNARVFAGIQDYIKVWASMPHARGYRARFPG